MNLPLATLFADLGVRVEYVDCTPETTVTGLVTDSRGVKRGQAFLALRGQTHDAHEFVSMAQTRGAAVAIVERGRIHAPTGPHVWLDDTAAVHAQLASNAFGRPAEHLTMLGITGTNGKTTTAFLLASILSHAGRAHARLGTTGNWIVDHEEPATFTTPFPVQLQGCLAHAHACGAQAAVMEVSSHALVQGRVDPIRFDAVGMTSFSQDHLDFHGSMTAYLDAKLRLAENHLHPRGIAIAAVDGQPGCRRFLERARASGTQAWSASRRPDPDAAITAQSVHLRPDRILAEIHTPHGPIDLHSPLVGAFNLDNLLVAIGMALAIDIPPATIATALAGAKGAPGRLERVEVDGFAGPTVVVDYAHTPDAVQRALATVRGLATGRVLVVLGCGGDRDATKRPRMAISAAEAADLVWVTSDNPRSEDPETILDDMLVELSDARHVHREVDRAAAIRKAIHAGRAGDVVLIAGKGHEDYQIIGDQRLPFDDREQARLAMNSG